MKKWFLTAAALALMTSGAAFADGMDNAVGNTVRVIVNDAGEGIDYYFEADGTVSNSVAEGSAAWAWTDGQLCITPPDEGAETTCGPWNESLTPGSEWQSGDWSQDGTILTFTLLEGRGHEAPTPPTPPAE